MGNSKHLGQNKTLPPPKYFEIDNSKEQLQKVIDPMIDHDRI